MAKIYSKNPDIVFRKIADEFILVPIKQKAADLQSIYTLNETAAFIWELIDGTRVDAEFSNKLSEEFDVEPSQADDDVSATLSEFESLGFIRKA